MACCASCALGGVCEGSACNPRTGFAVFPRHAPEFITRATGNLYRPAGQATAGEGRGGTGTLSPGAQAGLQILGTGLGTLGSAIALEQQRAAQEQQQQANLRIAEMQARNALEIARITAETARQQGGITQGQPQAITTTTPPQTAETFLSRWGIPLLIGAAGIGALIYVSRSRPRRNPSRRRRRYVRR